MKKVIFAFMAGQGLQVLLLWIALRITYSTNILGFCVVIGVVVTLALTIGSLGSLIELTTEVESAEFPEMKEAKLTDIFPAWGLHLRKDMDEVAPIPEELEVTNDSIKRLEE